jgi:hypothetical protein
MTMMLLIYAFLNTYIRRCTAKDGICLNSTGANIFSNCNCNSNRKSNYKNDFVNNNINIINSSSNNNHNINDDDIIRDDNPTDQIGINLNELLASNTNTQ